MSFANEFCARNAENAFLRAKSLAFNLGASRQVRTASILSSARVVTEFWNFDSSERDWLPKCAGVFGRFFAFLMRATSAKPIKNERRPLGWPA
jgi:hypothetical protein